MVHEGGQQDTVGAEFFVDLLRAGHPATMRAYGRSMTPTIRPGQTIEVAPPPFVPPLRRGDIVMLYADGVLCAHRLIAIRGGTLYQTRGDGRLRPDPAVPREAIVGRVVAVGGRPTAASRGRAARALVDAATALSTAPLRLGRTITSIVRRLKRTS